MKRLSFVIISAVVASAASSQNVQLHYDLGHSLYRELGGRPNVTTTVEMFRPDRWGSTFLFTDIDYYSDGAAGAYWEVAREVRIGHRGWAAHAEYNGGLTSFEHTAVAARFQHAALAGAAWNWASADLRRTFSAQLLYKQYFRGMGRAAFISVQATVVWGLSLCGGRLDVSGYTDAWLDPDVAGRCVVQSEPQAWYNLCTLPGWDDVRLSVGTEVELSYRFIHNGAGRPAGWYAIPTVALRWTF